MQIETGCLVAIDYILTNDAGDTLDTSKGSEPLRYEQGAGQIIPGLEKALEGKKTGEKISVSIPPEEAYGNKNPEMETTLPKEMFEGVEEIVPGMKFEAETDAGTQLVEVIKVDDKGVTIDANHPLAGETLNFDVEVVLVEKA